MRKFQALLGVELTEDEQDLAQCDASLLFSRSPAHGFGTAEVKKYLDLALQAGVPCVLVLANRDDILRDYALKQGVAAGNVLAPVDRRVSATQVAELVESLLGSYEITFDDCEELFPVCRPGQAGTAPVPIVLPEHNCVIYGVKGGVGVSMVASMLAANLAEGFHLEIGGRGRIPTGYCYHGSSLSEAGSDYGYWNEEGEFPALEGRMVVADLNQTVGITTADELISQTKCFIMVTDRSEVAFALVGELVTHGLKPDIFVVCGGLPGSASGCPLEVYKGEYADRLPDAVVEMPGGLDTERVIMSAQRRGVPPCLCTGGDDLNLACGELVSLVRGFMR